MDSATLTSLKSTLIMIGLGWKSFLSRESSDREKWAHHGQKEGVWMMLRAICNAADCDATELWRETGAERH